MAQNFWFSVDKMATSTHFMQRSNNGTWAPPRPLQSNILVDGDTTRAWYEYSSARTPRVQRAPGRAPNCSEYRTFSFYHDQGIIWIYTEDAIANTVGDGSGNRSLLGQIQVPAEEELDSDNEAQEDWKPLTFHPLANYASYASNRGPDPQLRFQQLGWVHQILPPRYHAPAQRPNVPAGYGGMTGPLPIIIALIAFSVPPAQVDLAVRLSMQGTYRPHNVPSGSGWNHRRGMVVRVFCAPDQRIHWTAFEMGTLGNFFR